MRWLSIRSLALCLLVLLVGCGGQTATATPEAVAAQVVKALDRQDTAALMALTDPATPMRDGMIGHQQVAWKNRILEPDFYFYDALGPFQIYTLEPTEQAGTTTVVPVQVQHKLGVAQLRVSLRQVDGAWKVIMLESKVVSHPKP